MMKKKSMAVAMAAVTVAMPMSQSFAAIVESDQTQEIKNMKDKAFELMNKEFTKNKNLLINPALAGEKVFKVSINGGAAYTRYVDFERAFDAAYNKLEDGESLTVKYEYFTADTGYTVLKDGSVVDFEADTFSETELKTLAGSNTESTDVKVGEVQAKTEDDNSKTYRVRLTDAKNDVKRFADVKVGDAELDFTKPVLRTDEAKDYYLDIDGNSIAPVEDNDVVSLAAGVVSINGDVHSDAVVDGFYLATSDAQFNGGTAKETYKADVETIVNDVIKKSVQKTTLNASELYNTNNTVVTSEGNTLLNKLQKLTYDLNKVDYTVTSTESKTGEELKIVVEKEDMNEPNHKKVKVEEITIVRDAADKKHEAFDAMKSLILSKQFSTNNTATEANYENKIAVAAGADRYETAAELSRKNFDKSNNIVLVTGEQDKLVDGLTATPLAATLNAPVLLTGNTKLAQPVIDEIDRLDAKTVYIVGGAISEELEKELEKKYGMEVERVSGDDRYDTALEVADEIYEQNGKTPFKNVFVVGGKSEADALSAGSIAAKLKAPILLTNEAKLDKDVKYYLDGSKVDKASKAYVVGGSISNSAYNDMLDVQGKGDIERLSGDTRQDTNAAVIEKFFTTDKVGKVVVAKSDNKGMVDALGAGLYAGLNNAPVVLATNSLSEDQEDALDKLKIEVDAATNLTKLNKLVAGEGIASSVVKYVKDLAVNVINK
ncbi:cell wall-binding repeat-containing protein [Romboutsia lituseburensis]|uniref:cell wall-binding repeat-containing protein n=1 Tax=Romboutsia lituseburensis TaxID=1537 RepID=UPI0022EAD567|nr:cell wall-binding repeat-containing protein [Romboutsia lituseburensis]